MNILSKLFRFISMGGGVNSKKMYSIQEAAKATGISEEKLYDLIREKKIKTLQFAEGGRYRIPQSEIERLSKQ